MPLATRRSQPPKGGDEQAAQQRAHEQQRRRGATPLAQWHRAACEERLRRNHQAPAAKGIKSTRVASEWQMEDFYRAERAARGICVHAP